MIALFSPDTSSSIQKRHPYTVNANSEMSGDSKSAFLHCGDVLGQSHLLCICLQGMALSAINGVGLSLVIPNAQSITADYYDELDRGKAFGALYMTSALGGAFGSLYATNQGRCHATCCFLFT